MHAAHAASPAPGSELPTILFLVVFSLGLVFVAARILRAERCVMRTCPVCAAAGVRALATEELDGGRVHLRAQCGQCGIWRRALTGASQLQAYERALKRDRRRIGDEAVRLVRRRTQRDLQAFVDALQAEVVGADDFLARARPRETSVPRPRRKSP